MSEHSPLEAELLAVNGISDAIDRLVDASRHGPHVAGSLQHFGDQNKKDLDVWLFVRAQLHQLLCSDSKEYQKERALLAKTAMPLVTFIAGAIAGKFGISYGAASALSAAMVLIPIKVGTRTWCAMYSASRDAISKKEAEAAYLIYTDQHLDAK